MTAQTPGTAPASPRIKVRIPAEGVRSLLRCTPSVHRWTVEELPCRSGVARLLLHCGVPDVEDLRAETLQAALKREAERGDAPRVLLLSDIGWFWDSLRLMGATAPGAPRGWASKVASAARGGADVLRVLAEYDIEFYEGRSRTRKAQAPEPATKDETPRGQDRFTDRKGRLFDVGTRVRWYSANGLLAGTGTVVGVDLTKVPFKVWVAGPEWPRDLAHDEVLPSSVEKCVPGEEVPVSSPRSAKLLPGGIPRWFRAYDNRGETFDRYTYLLTGKRGEGFYRGCSTHPSAPQGFGISDSTARRGAGGRVYHHPVDLAPGSGLRQAPAIGRKHPSLGWRVGWDELPPDVQKVLMRDYCCTWEIKLERPTP